MEGLKFRGRPPILIAGSVKDVVNLKNPYAQIIMDRRQTIDEGLVSAIVAQSIMGWERRHPAPALDQDGNFQGTDLDLLSFLTPIAARGAVIEIPRYRNRRRVEVRPNERKIGNNRFGPLIGLRSNQEVFSFSVLIHDKTIIKTNPNSGKEEVGDFRDFMIVDCDGHWYDGWDKIVWDPSREENRFLTEKGLWTGNTVSFQHYVHPNRWQSIFGAHHLLKKMLIARIDDEAGFYRGVVKQLKDLGLRMPSSASAKSAYFPSEEAEGPAPVTVPIVVKTMETVLDIPEFSGHYPPVAMNRNGLRKAYQRQKFLTYTLKPLVQFGVRANEAAYFLYGLGRIAPWMEGRVWKSNWKAPKGRAEWCQMVLGPDVALRYRVKSITQRVSAE